MELTIFEPLFNDEELESEFQSFFTRYGLEPLFTNEHRAGGISVTYLDARSVINPSGRYHNRLLELADLLQIAQDNKSYEEAVFKIIYDAKSFQGLMNTVRKVTEWIHGNINPEHEFNQWNIVWYTKEAYN